MLAAVPATTAVVASRAIGRRRRNGMSIASCCFGAVGGAFGANDVGLPTSVESVGQGAHYLFDDLARDSCALEDYPVRIAHRFCERRRPGVLPDEQRC